MLKYSQQMLKSCVLTNVKKREKKNPKLWFGRRGGVWNLYSF